MFTKQSYTRLNEAVLSSMNESDDKMLNALVKVVSKYLGPRAVSKLKAEFKKFDPDDGEAFTFQIEIDPAPRFNTGIKAIDELDTSTVLPKGMSFVELKSYPDDGDTTLTYYVYRSKRDYDKLELYNAYAF